MKSGTIGSDIVFDAEDRGCLFHATDNEDFAKEVLLRENYFFLNGYRYPFVKSRDEKVYIEGTTFEELYATFLFDRRI